MQKFTSLTGVAAPLDLINVDTDMIIPARFLKSIKRTGFGKDLFYTLRYDEDGNPQTSNLADYTAISMMEVPMYERSFTETSTPRNPLGAKGIGEAGSIGSTPAVQSAVIDALAPFGIRHLDMPLTPERIWSALQSSGA